MAKQGFFQTIEKKLHINKIQFVLFVILVVWSIAVFSLLKTALVNNPYSIITWTSLNTIFTGFSSLALVIIAIILVNKVR